jgi:hypothetical protein
MPFPSVHIRLMQTLEHGAVHVIVILLGAASEGEDDYVLYQADLHNARMFHCYFGQDDHVELETRRAGLLQLSSQGRSQCSSFITMSIISHDKY